MVVLLALFILIVMVLCMLLPSIQLKDFGAFSTAIKEHSTTLATMGGTAQEGLTKFSKIVNISPEIKD